jgi:hypothetical protein
MDVEKQENCGAKSGKCLLLFYDSENTFVIESSHVGTQ